MGNARNWEEALCFCSLTADQHRAMLSASQSSPGKTTLATPEPEDLVTGVPLHAVRPRLRSAPCMHDAHARVTRRRSRACTGILTSRTAPSIDVIKRPSQYTVCVRRCKSQIKLERFFVFHLSSYVRTYQLASRMTMCVRVVDSHSRDIGSNCWRLLHIIIIGL